jgi:hypothetical protein
VTSCVFSANEADYAGGMYNYDYSSPEVTDCTFSVNNASNGGGMHNETSSPTVTGCTFEGNTSTNGGGMFNANSPSLEVTGCDFLGNSANYGGGMYGTNSPETVSNCTFSGNTATYGGGMCNYDNSSPAVTGCTFYGNSATEGGGMYNNNNSSPTVSKCTFTGNPAYHGGGMCNNNNSSPAVTNCTFYGNSATEGGGMYNNNNSSPAVTNCTFYGNSAAFGGGMYNYDSSPTVTNCILWGDDCLPEILDEGTSAPAVTYCDVDGEYYPPGTGNIEADPLFVDPSTGDYHLQAGSPCIDVGDNSAPSLPSTDFEGDPRIMNGVVDMGVDEYYVPATEVWVDDDYCDVCPNDGHTWGYDAFDKIQDGIDAVTGSTVHVAAGYYIENITLIDGVEVLGAGAGVSFIDGGESGSVVTAIGVGSSTRLDGFTITNGTGTYDASFDLFGGGGMLNNSSSLTVSNCTFESNSTDFGGGMANTNSSLVVADCTFSGNSADYGGGMFNDNSTTEVTNCTFSGNTATNGGGMFNRNGSSPTVTNCTFSGNTSLLYGGGMCNWDNSSPTLTNCIFWDGGGEIYNDGTSAPVVTYCDIEGEGIYPGTGNINADPLFVNTAGGDFHLQAGSPCIDAGNNSAPSLPSTDFEGDPRVVNDVVDMGVDEYYVPAGSGLLRVLTSPAVPTTIFLDGIPRNGWGLTWVKMPEGEYMLSFSDVYGFATPTEVEIIYHPYSSVYPGSERVTHPLSEPIEILPNTVTEVIVNFIQLGNLRIDTSPAVPTIISLNGSPANDWGLWVSLLPGDYYVSVTNVFAFATPTEVEIIYPTFSGEPRIFQPISDPITVYPGGTTHVILHFAQLGNLRVDTSPALPATIFLDGYPMNDWGFWVNLEPGTYVVSFEDIGYGITPPATEIEVYAGTTTHVIGNYDTGEVIIP